jgi:hypothetical protein
MTLGKLAVIFVAVALGAGGVGAALADWRSSSDAGAAIELDGRKNELDDGPAFVGDDDDDRGDGDRTRGNDGTSGGNNTGDGDRTRGNDGTSGGNNTGVGSGGGTGGGGTGGGGTGGGGTT